jgi:myo-inositol 2-dehydrogenase/D-chiro-inositol 1-dehydrogenase
MGYPLLLEKPPGMNVEEIDTMLEIARTNNIPHQVALNRRFSPLQQRMRALITENSKQQELQHLIYTFSRFDSRDEDFSLTAIHGIDTARFLIGADYEWIRFEYQNQPAKGSHVYNVQLNCQFTNGVTGHISFCPVTGMVIERADVFALDKSYHLTMPLGPIEDTPSHPGLLEYYAYNELVEKTNAQTFTKSKEFDVLNGFYGENASFFDDIKAGRSPAYTLDVIRQSVAIMECIRNRKTEYHLHPQ